MVITDIINLFIGFFIGALSSGAVWYLLAMTKPKIAISPMIVYEPETNRLRIRVINRSRRQASRIKVLFFVGEKYSAFYRTIHTPKLNRRDIFALGSKNNFGKYWVLPTSTIFSVTDGKQVLDILSQHEKGERRLVFTLSATDALSGSEIIQRVSYSIDDVKFGKFNSGTEFHVIESSTSYLDDELQDNNQ